MNTIQHAPPAAPPGVPRWHARYAAPVSADIAGDRVLLYHPVENISLGGACVTTPAPEQVGTRVHVTLSFGDAAASVRLCADVAWACIGPPARMGLRWVGMTAAQRRQLSGRLRRSGSIALSPAGDANSRARA